MAETFEKPKKFTQEWFSYIWCYYKYHILASLIAVLLIVVTIFEVATTVKPDGTVYYVASNSIHTETEQKILKKLSEEFPDFNGDGKTYIAFTQMNFTPEIIADSELSNAMRSKMMTTLASDDGMLYILDEPLLKDVLSLKPAQNAFMEVADWSGVKDESLLYQSENGIYGVCLSESRFFRELGIDASGLYLVVRKNYKPENKKLIKTHADCVELANLLLEN